MRGSGVNQHNNLSPASGSEDPCDMGQDDSWGCLWKLREGQEFRSPKPSKTWSCQVGTVFLPCILRGRCGSKSQRGEE